MAKRKITKTIVIDPELEGAWNGLTNKSHTVELVLKLANALKHPDEVNIILRDAFKPSPAINT
jgi:hypothetical protein